MQDLSMVPAETVPSSDHGYELPDPQEASEAWLSDGAAMSYRLSRSLPFTPCAVQRQSVC